MQGQAINTEPRSSPAWLARLAGALYLIVAIAGGFAEFTRVSVRVAGDAAATAANVRASADMLRIAFASDLVDILCFLLAALVLYVLLSGASRGAAAIFVVLNAIAVAIMGANLLDHVAALIVATDPSYAATLGRASADAFTLFFLDLHRVGYLVAQIFFGLWLLPLGYAVYRSGLLPRALGLVLMAACAGYLADVVASVTSPGFASSLTPYLAVPAGLCELSFVLWLLVKGASPRLANTNTETTGQGALLWTA